MALVSGCNFSLHCANLSSIAARINSACLLVLQCTIASSTYLSNGTVG